MAEKDEKSCFFCNKKIFIKYRCADRNRLLMRDAVVKKQTSDHCNNAPVH